MKSEQIAQLMTINNGRKAMKTGKALLQSAETLEEKAAARAYRRITSGTLILLAVLVLGFAILMPICLTSLELEDGMSRIGTVQQDGQVRYTDNVHIFLSQEELELQEYHLQPGDEVVIYFDAETEEVTSGYPYAVFEQHTNIRLGIMLGFVVIMIVVLIVYAVVICRVTPFGKAWYDYCKKQKEADTKEIPLRVQVVIYAISAVIAIAVCWPQIQNLVDEVQRMQKIEAVQDLIQSGQKAADDAESMADALETLGENVDASGALEDAENAAKLIGEILDSLNEE